MNRFLLDTHVLLWFQATPDRLKRSTLRAIEDPEAELWLSPVSTFEVLLATRRDRVQIAGDLERWLRNTEVRFGLREATLTHDVVLHSQRLKLEHGDPADRLIAATALWYDLTLVTADRELLKCHDIRTLRAA